MFKNEILFSKNHQQECGQDKKVVKVRKNKLLDKILSRIKKDIKKKNSIKIRQVNLVLMDNNYLSQLKSNCLKKMIDKNKGKNKDMEKIVNNSVILI